jgi:hypothetical protein
VWDLLMRLNQKKRARRGTMRFVRRFVVVALLAFAFVAGPIGALCSSCCPEGDTARKLGAAMPCCDDGCGPTFVTAKPSAPAIAAARSTLDRPSGVVTAMQTCSGPSAEPGTVFVLPSESPPFGSKPHSSVLRL